MRRKARIRQKGQRYRPIVTVHKAKNGTPTVVDISGMRYQLQHQTQYKRR